jgi:hypothetical protein
MLRAAPGVITRSGENKAGIFPPSPIRQRFVPDTIQK